MKKYEATAKQRPTLTYTMSGGKRMVQTLGYVPMKNKVENLMNAGVRLASARAEQYDADSKIDPKEIIENRLRRLDLLDGLYQTTQLKQHLLNRRKNLEEQFRRNANNTPSTDEHKTTEQDKHNMLDTKQETLQKQPSE
jgi:hypothetical protein